MKRDVEALVIPFTRFHFFFFCCRSKVQKNLSPEDHLRVFRCQRDTTHSPCRTCRPKVLTGSLICCTARLRLTQGCWQDDVHRERQAQPDQLSGWWYAWWTRSVQVSVTASMLFLLQSASVCCFSLDVSELFHYLCDSIFVPQMGQRQE